jgi:hypothetical protein
MAKANPGWEVIEETATERPQPQVQQPDPNAVAVAMIQIGLKALSQRALTAATDLFTLVTCAGAWWLWYLTPEPSYLQIVHNSIFAVFVLAANWIVRRK